MALPVLSDEQERVVRSGLPGLRDHYEWVDLPLGRQELPPWLRGSKVHWNGYYSNSPHLSLSTWRYDDPRLNTDEYRMPKLYRAELPGVYVDRHPDGRVHHLTHRSPVVWITLQRYVGYPLDEHGRADFKKKPIYEDYQAWATADRQGGFGGETYRIRVACDGPGEHVNWSSDLGYYRWVELRGPWHSSPPADCVECGSGMGGLTITKDLFLRVVSTYHPTHRLALVTYNGVTTLDLVHSDWDVPKQFLPRDHPVWNTNNNPYAGSSS